jgi:hypothetical protein
VTLYRTPGKSDWIYPGQCSAIALDFFGDNPPTWFLDRGKAALLKLCQHGRLTAAGTA